MPKLSDSGRPRKSSRMLLGTRHSVSPSSFCSSRKSCARKRKYTPARAIYAGNPSEQRASQRMQDSFHQEHQDAARYAARAWHPCDCKQRMQTYVSVPKLKLSLTYSTTQGTTRAWPQDSPSADRHCAVVRWTSQLPLRRLTATEATSGQSGRPDGVGVRPADRAARERDGSGAVRPGQPILRPAHAARAAPELRRVSWPCTAAARTSATEVVGAHDATAVVRARRDGRGTDSGRRRAALRW